MGRIVRFDGPMCGPVDRVSVSLCIYGDDLEPSAVTRLLGSSPSRAWRKGEIRDPNRPTPERTGVWVLELGTADRRPLGEQISALLDLVTPDLEAWRRLLAQHQARVFCMLSVHDWNRECGVPAGQLQRLSERGLDLDFDIYADEE